MEETISSCGYLRVDSQVRLKFWRLATSLLLHVARNFVKRSVCFRSETNRFPFVYSEKALNSVLLPSIADWADAVTTEYPVRRKTRGRGSTFGFLDYWVFHHKALLLVEAKHVWVNPRTNKVTKHLRENWKEAIHQTDLIPMSAIRLELDYTGLDASKVFRVPILVSPFWSSTRNEKLIEYEREYLIDCHEKICGWLRPRPNWAALWLLKPELQGPYDWSAQTPKFDSYPAVGVYSYVHVRS